MNDCISRQAVLRLIDSYGGIDLKARQDMLKIIQKMPSVTPTLKECDDCISRQAIDEIKEIMTDSMSISRKLSHRKVRDK